MRIERLGNFAVSGLSRGALSEPSKPFPRVASCFEFSMQPCRQRLYDAGIVELRKLVWVCNEIDGVVPHASVGSFIQHTHVPYTGSYGGVLLTGLSALFALLSGSELDIAQADRGGIYRAIDEAMVPVMVEGQVLAAVRGRSVSRNFESGATDGGAILGAMLMLAKYAPAHLGQRWQSVCKGWLERSDFDNFFDTSNIVRLSLMRIALDEPSSAPALTTPTMYPSMDRLIHRTPTWTAAIAMCSNRIAWYEFGNGENELGPRTGSGMRYLYLPGQFDQYEDAFWPTMDHAAPPGATVDQTPLEPKVGGEWGENTPDNE